MIWLTWRQLRVQTAVVCAALLALAVAFLATRSDVLAAYHAGIEDFLDRLAASRTDNVLFQAGSLTLWAAPAVIGAFWGAPLVAREVEAGTHRLVWTQSVTRTRWLATRLGVGAAAAMAGTGLLSLVLTWWCSPIDKAVAAGHESGVFSVPRIVPDLFGARGVAPIAYAGFAFMLGAAAGAMLRRTVPAMAIVLAAYLAVQIALPFTVRPHLAAATVRVVTITSENLHGMVGKGPNQIDGLDVGTSIPGAWVQSRQTIGRDGQPLSTIPGWIGGCLPLPPQPGADGTRAVSPPTGPEARACFDRLAAEGIRQRVTYQPASHYWTLQWREAGAMIGAAALLAWLCFWRVRRLS